MLLWTQVVQPEHISTKDEFGMRVLTWQIGRISALSGFSVTFSM